MVARITSFSSLAMLTVVTSGAQRLVATGWNLCSSCGLFGFTFLLILPFLSLSADGSNLEGESSSWVMLREPSSDLTKEGPGLILFSDIYHILYNNRVFYEVVYKPTGVTIYIFM